MSNLIDEIRKFGSKTIMKLGDGLYNGKLIDDPLSFIKNFNKSYTSPALDTYLLPKDLLKEEFYKNGYIEGTPNDYGLVRKAVGNRDVPIYQTAADSKSRNQLVHIGNYNNSSFNYDFLHPNSNVDLRKAGNYPTAMYIDSDGNFYTKSWDLNDYGDSTAGSGTKYDAVKLGLANFIDKIGSPTVVTTGFLPSLEFIEEDGTKRNRNIFNVHDYNKLSEELRNLVDTFFNNQGMYLEFINGKLEPIKYENR